MPAGLEACEAAPEGHRRPGRRSTARATSAVASINVDKKYKIIRRIETDTASTHDSQHFDNVFDAGNTSRDVYADRGYPSEAREAWLKEKGFRNQIQRKGKTSRCPSASSGVTSASPNARPGRARFGALEQMGGKLLRTIGQARSELRDDDDGRLLQPEAAGLFRKAGIEAF